MITAYIKGQVLKVVQPVLASDTIDYITAQFFFKTSDWNGFIKWAHFKQGNTVYDIELTDDKIDRTAHLNLSAGVWELYLHGNKDGERITTVVERIEVKQTGALNGQPLPEIPLTAAEQILLTAERAENIAQSVRNDADAGLFKGEKGEKGDKGDKGDPGESATTYEHHQMQASDAWEIVHDLQRFPSVTVVDSAGTKVAGDVCYLDDTTVIVSFSAPFSGVAYLN